MALAVAGSGLGAALAAAVPSAPFLAVVGRTVSWAEGLAPFGHVVRLVLGRGDDDQVRWLDAAACFAFVMNVLVGLDRPADRNGRHHPRRVNLPVTDPDGGASLRRRAI
jgi:hypothetical protein